MKRVVWGVFIMGLSLCQVIWAQTSTQSDPSWDDVWVTSRFDYGSDYGVDDEKLQAGGWSDYYYFLIRPELSGLPSSATKATLWLYCLDRGDTSTPVGMDLYQITSAWDENVGWYGQPTAAILSSSLPAPVEAQWYSVDITDWYNQTQSGAVTNYGLEFRPLGNTNQFSVFASSDYADAAFRPKLVVEEGDTEQTLEFSFPLPDLSPYTARVVSVFDHDRRWGSVVAYNGEAGTAEPYIYAPKVVGYKKEGVSDFVLPLLPAYDDEVPGSGGKTYLFYDNHNGYDYPAVGGTPILAAADGNLALATKVARPPRRGDGLWRNKDICPLPGSMGNEWSDNHTVFITHGVTGYTTWYLHVEGLEPDVKFQIVLQGYVEVSRGQVIAYVGGFGAGGRDHLHFGVRKDWVLVDPYGTGLPDTTEVDILWEEKP